MAIRIITEIAENDQQPLLGEEKGAQSYSSLPPDSQPEMTPEAKLTFIEGMLRTELTWGDQWAFSFGERELHLGFESPPKPWLPPRLLQKIDKMKRTPLKREEMLALIEDIARVSIDFYQVRPRKCIAMRFDGRIVESANTEIDLLLKIQGKEFDMPVFVWQVGSESFSGWRT